MSSYTAEMLHGLDRASPPSPRHPKPRWQVRYRDGTRERSAGIYTSPKAAETVRKRVERGLPALVEAPAEDVDTTKAQTLFGDYVEKVWWPTWKAQHPDSAYQTGKRIEKRILPTLGNTPFAALDADRIGAWKASLVAAGLKPSSVNSYLSLLGTILNAAVDSEYLSRSPLMRRSRAGRVAAAKNLPVSRARYGSPAASSTASAKRSIPATRPSSRWPR
jgi:hypothetical protein